MAAYLIAEHRITNPERFDEYRGKVAPMLDRFGGRYLTRGGSHEIPDGDWKPARVVIEFPDMATLKVWYNSPEYQPPIEIRRGTGTDVLIAIVGL